jgi:hypothetical protein
MDVFGFITGCFVVGEGYYFLFSLALQEWQQSTHNAVEYFQESCLVVEVRFWFVRLHLQK